MNIYGYLLSTWHRCGAVDAGDMGAGVDGGEAKRRTTNR